MTSSEFQGQAWPCRFLGPPAQPVALLELCKEGLVLLLLETKAKGQVE